MVCYFVVFSSCKSRYMYLSVVVYRRSECTFHGTPLNKGTAFKEGCEKW